MKVWTHSELRCYDTDLFTLFDHGTVCQDSVQYFWEQIMEIQITTCISCQWPTYLFTIDLVSLEIGCWSLKKTPVSPLVVCDISFHLVLNNFIWQEHPFNPSNLQTWEAGSSEKKNNNKKKEKKGESGIWRRTELFKLKQSWRARSEKEEEISESDNFSDMEHYFGPSVGLQNQNNIWHSPEIFLPLYTRVQRCKPKNSSNLCFS